VPTFKFKPGEDWYFYFEANPICIGFVINMHLRLDNNDCFFFLPFSAQDTESDGMPIAEAKKVGLRLGFSEAQVGVLIRDLDKDANGQITKHELPRKSSIKAFLLFNFVAAPIMLFIVCIVLGALLAAIEGWSFLDGFYFVGCDISG